VPDRLLNQLLWVPNRFLNQLPDGHSPPAPEQLAELAGGSVDLPSSSSGLNILLCLTLFIPFMAS
jgi:hypothetical protein